MAISSSNFLNSNPVQPRTEVPPQSTPPPAGPQAPPITAAGGAPAPAPQQAQPSAQGGARNSPLAKAVAEMSPEDRERAVTGVTPAMAEALKKLGLNDPGSASLLDAFGTLHLKNSIRLPGVTVTFSPRHRALVDQIGQEKIAKTLAKLFQLENAPLDTTQSDIAGPPTGGLV